MQCGEEFGNSGINCCESICPAFVFRSQLFRKLSNFVMIGAAIFGQNSLDEVVNAVPDEVSIGFDFVVGVAPPLQDGVGRCCDFLQRIQKGSVKIKENDGELA